MTAGRREATKLANRTAILDAARDVFAQADYGAVSVRDIVRRTDLATGTFYNYFPDKESVLRALMDDAGVRARHRVRAGRRAGRTYEEFVHGGYRAYFDFIAEDPGAFAISRRNPATFRALFDEPTLGAGIEDLREDLDLAVEQGLLAPVDTEYLAAAMVGVGVEVGWRMLERDPIDPAGAAAFASALFLGGMRQ